MTRIFIEGYELDLTKGISNQITYAIDDLQNLDSKSTSFTKTIILPGTANNNKLLGNIFEFNNANFDNPFDANVLANFNAARNATARIEVDGLQIMKGVLRLLEIIHIDGDIEYECAIFGELGGFINALGNKRLEDLDFSTYNHTYSVANIVSSWDTSGSTSYCYPLIDYGNVSTGVHGVLKKDFQYTTFKPALFVREYLDKIFTSSGYTYECDLFNTTDFRKLIIPNNAKQLTKETSDVLTLSKITNQVMNNISSVDFVSYPIKTGSLFTSVSGNTQFEYIGTNILYTTFEISIEGDYSVPTAGEFDLSVTKNGSLIEDSSETFTGSGSLYYNKTFNLTINPNDKIRIRSRGLLEDFDFLNINYSNVSVINNVATTSPIELGDTMVINNTIPKGIFQKDFVTSIMKMYNLMLVEDKYKTNHLVIKPYVDFYDGEVIDWSDKLDHSKAIKIKPMSEINARYYNFKYKQDNDFYNEEYRKKFTEGYGDRVYDNGLEFVKDTEGLELIFASSPLFGTSTTDKVFPAIYKKSSENTKEDPMDHVMRILQIKKITGVASWRIYNDNVHISENTFYLYAGHLNDPTTPTLDINFGAPQQLFFNLSSGNLSSNLFNVYYSPYMAEITEKDSRLLTGFFHLTELDIFNLNFAKYIFLQGGIYKLVKVYDYSPNSYDTTKVDLLRVIDAIIKPITTSTTTSTTTAAPTTTTSTTTTTTTAATTSTTTTTTTLPTFDASYSMVSAYDVCNNVCPNPARPVETFTITSGGSTLCTADELTSPLIADGTITGNFWISECTGQSKQFVVILESGQYVAVWATETCSTCPDVTTTTTSTTTTTTTAAPTTTTTTTAAPTTTTTTTAAPTTTTSTTTSTTTAAPTTTTSTTTTTTTPAPNHSYEATRCSDGATSTLIVSTSKSVGAVYTSAPSGTSQCYTLTSYNGPVDLPTNITLYTSVLECADSSCVQTTTTTTTTLAPTTTTSTTTTTTTPDPYTYYILDRYLCDPCSLDGSSVAIARSSSSSLNALFFNFVDGYVYLTNGTTSGPSYTFDIDTESAKSGSDCTDVCQL